MNSFFVRFHLPPILWGLTIFALSSIPSTSFPNLSIFSQDKLLHAGVFFVFAFLLYRSFRNQSRFPFARLHAKVWTLGAAALYGITDELHQLYVTGRSADYRDVIADALGALLLVALVWIWERFGSKTRNG